MIACYISQKIFRVRNIYLTAELLACLLWTEALAFPSKAQAQTEETSILPETISSGLAHACGIRGNGTLICWGRDDHEQETPPTGTFRQVSAGSYHTCAIHNDGSLVCWGHDFYGQASPPPETFTQFSAGGYHSCAFHHNGIITCWGNNPYGQLDFDLNPFFTSTPVTEAIMNKPYAYTITATDPDMIHNYYLNIEATGLPSWLTLTDHGDGTATLTGTPDPSHLGDHQVVLVVYDENELQNTQAFTITVDYVNQPPFFTSSAIAEAINGMPYTYDIVTSDPDMVFGDTLTISATSLPEWLSINDKGDGTASHTGIPTEADIGHHPIVLEVSDLGG